MEKLLQKTSVVLPILSLMFLFSSANGGEKTSGGLFIMKDGKSFNGNFINDSIQILTSSGQKTITSNDIFSIYSDKLRTRLKWKQTILEGKIIDSIKVEKIKGSSTIKGDDLFFFNRLIKTPVDQIKEVHIIEDDFMVWGWGEGKSPSAKVSVTVMTEYWGGKRFNLSKPVYQTLLEDPTKPIEFSFDIQAHSDVNEETVTMLFISGSTKDGGRFQTGYSNSTPISAVKGKNAKLRFNQALVHRVGETLEGRGYIIVFLVPKQWWSKAIVPRGFPDQQLKIYNTISNVLRLPIEIKKK